MKVLVTGAAGYIGSLLVPELLQRGFQVLAVDSFLYGQTSLSDCCSHPNFEIIRGDARNRDLLGPLVATADVLIPLASIVGAPACEADPIAARTTNVDAVSALLEMRGADTMILYPTTNSGYGIGEDSVHCTESTPLRPVSSYGRQKVEAERAVLEAGGVTFRFATLFGMSPRMRLDLLVNDFAYRAVHDRALVLFEANFKRNFLHVRDAVRAFLHGIDHFERMRGQAYNVGLSDANLSKLELCETIRERVPGFFFTESPIGEDVDKRNYIVSNEKIEATGFLPEHSIDDGLVELIKGFQILRRERFGNV